MDNRVAFFKSSNKNPKLIDELIFEIKALFIRKCIQRNKSLKPVHNFLNLGCGENANAGFDNVDAPRFRYKKNNILSIDLRHKLPYKDSVYEGIFIEHTLEHFSPTIAFNLLSEIFRILKPEGTIRIIVPDLDIYLSQLQTPIQYFSHLHSPAETIYSLTQDWGHKSVYNYEIMEPLLKEIGFESVCKLSYREGTESLLIDQITRQPESLYVEAKKPK
jgi:predicted SAM-dependent methyltransferase